MDFLQHLVDAPVANILIVAGLLFLGIGAVGKVTGKIEPDRAGRLVAGVLGLILLIVGVLIHVSADATIKITPNQAQNVFKPTQNSPIQPIVHVFSVTPAEITKGNKVTIRWEVQNADQVDLEPFGQVSPTGTTIDQPQKTTVYKLSASNKGGEKAGDIREVIVNEPKAPPISADATTKSTPNQAQNVFKPTQNSPIQPIVHVFSVTPAEITKGNKVTIRWEVQNADQVDLEPFGQVSPTGTTIDQPQKTTVYKLSASNKDGEKAGDIREVIVNEPKAPPSNPIPNFAGTWELTEYTLNGRTVPVTNAQHITITQSGSLVRIGNKQAPINPAGRVTYQDFAVGDNKGGHAVNTEAEADRVGTLTWRLDGPILIFETIYRYKRQYFSHPPRTNFRTMKYRRVSP